MTLTQFFLDELDREAPRTRRTLEAVPAGKDDWKPHDKSMPLLRLAALVATMPSWVGLILTQDELDVRPKGGGQWSQPSHDQLIPSLDKAVAGARAALSSVDDEFLLNTTWRILADGKVMREDPRHVVMRELHPHLAHHRGQLSVYLRLLGAKVPSIYGPSADDQHFG
jgi:uncharacterized damage-inducible protein DinB